MHRFLAVIVLILMAPLVAEVLPGSTPIASPALLLSDVLIYGSGALLIRELVRHRGRGWPSILLLGAAYGLIEEGLALQSLFNPAYNHVSEWGARVLGINGVYTELVIIIHVAWSAAIPILLTELLFPAQRSTPYLHRFGLVATSIWYILGVALLGLFARTAYPYDTPPLLLGLVLVIALLLAVIALGVVPLQSPRQPLQLKAPQPRAVLLVSVIGAFAGLALPALLWRAQPAFAHFPLVLVPLLGTLGIVAAMIWLVRHWAQAGDWSDRHRLALAGGALLAHSVVGGLIFTKTASQGITILVLTLVMIGLLGLFAIKVRGRVDALASAARSEGQLLPMAAPHETKQLVGQGKRPI